LVKYSAHNFWPKGDYYAIMDLGEDYPVDERYPFSYNGGSTGIGDLYPGGVIKFVRTFKPPAKITVAGPNPDLAGCIIYEFERTVSGKKVTRYQATYFWNPHLPPTILIDYQKHPSHPPAAGVGQANGYERGSGNTQETDTLAGAIAQYGHPGTGVKGSGGMTDFISNMTIYYCFNPNYP
jgi:hypothetical protein